VDRVPVSSTSIASIGYDGASSTLELEYRHGGLYRYFEVPPDVYQELMAAPSAGASIGRYVVERIRTAYRYEQVGELEAPRGRVLYIEDWRRR
jgi:hypothetical protein